MNRKLIILSIGTILFLVSFIFFVSAESGETFTEFEIVSVRPSCQFSVDGTTTFWVWWEGKIIEEEVTDSSGNCYKGGGYPSTTCCPSGYTCNIATKICIEGTIYLCGQYNDEDSCNNFNYDVGIFTIEELTGISPFCNTWQDYNESCVRFIGNCRCEWREDQCDAIYDSVILCEGEIPIGECDFSPLDIRDECEESGFLYYIVKANWTGEENSSIIGYDECVDKESKSPCGKPFLKLSGFSLFALVSALVLIFIIYYFTRKRRH